MIESIAKLTVEEQGVIYSAPILVAILVAGADGNIDKAEMREAISISNIKQFKARRNLIGYYTEVGQDFEDKLKIGISKFSSQPKERQVEIEEELKKLNGILKKLDKALAIEFYESLKDFGKKIAEASGGVLGYMSIGYEESKLIELKMIKDPHTF